MTTPYDYITIDVFTDRPFGGNPLAVVTDARGLTTEQMQAIAAEFNYSESTFVLPPDDRAHTARVRIFTRTSEIPFAGHPNVGTAFALALVAEWSARTMASPVVFEEAAGLVPVELMRDPAGRVQGATLTAPQSLKASPLGTEGSGWDVGWGAVYLASDESRWVTGHTLIIDAGVTAR